MERIVVRPSATLERDRRTGSVHLEISREMKGSDNLDYKVEPVANFSLTYLPDTNEVVLLKGDEAVYSELLP